MKHKARRGSLSAILLSEVTPMACGMASHMNNAVFGAALSQVVSQPYSRHTGYNKSTASMMPRNARPTDTPELPQMDGLAFDTSTGLATLLQSLKSWVLQRTSRGPTTNLTRNLKDH